MEQFIIVESPAIQIVTEPEVFPDVPPLALTPPLAGVVPPVPGRPPAGEPPEFLLPPVSAPPVAPPDDVFATLVPPVAAPPVAHVPPLFFAPPEVGEPPTFEFPPVALDVSPMLPPVARVPLVTELVMLLVPPVLSMARLPPTTTALEPPAPPMPSVSVPPDANAPPVRMTPLVAPPVVSAFVLPVLPEQAKKAAVDVSRQTTPIWTAGPLRVISNAFIVHLINRHGLLDPIRDQAETGLGDPVCLEPGQRDRAVRPKRRNMTTS